MASKKHSKSSTTQRALHRALGRYLECYARYFLAGEWPLPRFRVVQRGADLEVAVQAPDGRQVVRRRAGAYLSLAGAFWGASRGPAERAQLPVLIPALTAYPLGDANGWDLFHDFTWDEEVLDALHGIAVSLTRGGRNEAILLLRRALAVDRHWHETAVPLQRPVAAKLAPAVSARSPVVEPLLHKKSYYPNAIAKAVASGARSADATERLASAICLASAASMLVYGNQLRFFRTAEAAIEALVLEGEGYLTSSQEGRHRPR